MGEALAPSWAVGWLKLQLVSSYFKADGTIQIALNFTGLGPRCQTSFDRWIKQRDGGRQEHTGRKRTVFYHQIRKTRQTPIPTYALSFRVLFLAQIFYKKVEDDNKDSYQTNAI